MSGVVITENIGAGIKTLTQEQHRRAVAVMVKSANRIKNSAKSRLVWRSSPAGPGGRATGALQRGIHDKVTSQPGQITGTVESTVGYGKFIEGKPVPRRHFVPFAIAPGLREWARRHGTPATWWSAKSKGMMVGGKKSVTPFMEPAFKDSIKQVRRDFENALRPR